MTSPSENEGFQTTPDAASSHEVHTTPDAHGHAAEPDGPHFSDREWKEFQDDDVHAGGAIVCLMAGIFTIGLMLYTTIAIIVAA